MSTPPDGYRFPLALRQILERYNVSFPDILVGLARADAMREYPPVQFMLQSLPQSGYFRPLMGASTMEHVDRLAGEFVRLTGYGPEAAMYLFHSVAFARGLIDVAPEVPAPADVRKEGESDYGPDAAAEPECPYGDPETTGTPRWNHYGSETEKLRLLNSLIEVLHDNEDALGVSATLAACVGVSSDSFRLSAELRRIAPQAGASLTCAVYGRHGRILDTVNVGTVTSHSPSLLPRTARVDVRPQDVGKILFFWE